MLQEEALTRDETEALVQMEGTFEEVKVITGFSKLSFGLRGC